MDPFILLIILIIAYIAVCFIESDEVEYKYKYKYKNKNIENIASVNFRNNNTDNNTTYYYDPRSYDVGWLSDGELMPWWNSTRFTRNMSYDLRGDIPIRPEYVGPWLNSPFL